ncbi:MAG: hypothetical protein ABI831_05645 [Betaproteobacteria bacterium]
MEMTIARLGEDSRVVTIAGTGEASASAVSWGAIMGGAAAAAAISLILLALGSGLGLSAISPWAYEGASATAVGVGAIAWLILMSAAASALGGYLSGRLRTKWVDTDRDEVFFRDTAHGLLAWAVATIFTAAVLTSAAGAMVGTAVRATGTAVGSIAPAAGVAGAAIPGQSGADEGNGSAAAANSGSYYTDMLFRTDRPADASLDMNLAGPEAARILTTTLRSGDLNPGDRTYLSQLVARRTGLSPVESEQRVTQTMSMARQAADTAATRAREAADAARKATARLALWVFVSLLAGAFCAALAATVGGRQRDLDASNRAAFA